MTVSCVLKKSNKIRIEKMSVGFSKCRHINNCNRNTFRGKVRQEQAEDLLGGKKGDSGGVK